jgi:hypothetical protein
MEIPIRVDQRTQQSLSDPFCADLKAHHACCLSAGNRKEIQSGTAVNAKEFGNGKNRAIHRG